MIKFEQKLVISLELDIETLEEAVKSYTTEIVNDLVYNSGLLSLGDDTDASDLDNHLQSEPLVEYQNTQKFLGILESLNRGDKI